MCNVEGVRFMKVAYLLGSLPRGGTETLMLDVFRNADKAPYEFIGIHRKGGAYRDDFYATGQRMIQLAPKRFGYVRYLIQLRRTLQSEGVNVVHAQHWLDGLYARLASLGMDIRVMITLHGFFSKKGINGKLCSWSIRKADDVCFVSQYEKEWYQARYSIQDDKCHVIYNGIDFSKIDSVVEGGKCKVEGERLRLCMVGNFNRVRSQLVIVKSLKYLHHSGVSNLDFDFVGKRVDVHGALYDECVRICEENHLDYVHFMGGRDDVPSILKACDGFVYSSANDTFGIAVVEAMAAGLPVVVNDWPVMKEVCGDGGSVSIFRSDDVMDCATKIQQLLNRLINDKENLQRECEQQSLLVRQEYSIEAYINRLTNIYTCYDNKRKGN